jgi:hypothetical protein
MNKIGIIVFGFLGSTHASSMFDLSLGIDDARAVLSEVKACEEGRISNVFPTTFDVEVENHGSFHFDRPTVSSDGSLVRANSCEMTSLLTRSGYRKARILRHSGSSQFADVGDFFVIPESLRSLEALSGPVVRLKELGALLEHLKEIHSLGMTLSNLSGRQLGSTSSGEVTFKLHELDLYLFKLDTNINNRFSYKFSLLRLITLFTEKRMPPVFQNLDVDGGEVPDLSDPLLAFADAVNRAGDERPFDYDTWITFFRRVSTSNPTEIRGIAREYWETRGGPIVPVRTPHEYWKSFDRCIADLDLVTCSREVVRQCQQKVPGTAFEQLELGSVQFDGPSIEGTTAFAFRSSDSKLFLKMSKLNRRRGTCELAKALVCNEKAILGVLQGLGGLVPRLYPLPDGCIGADAQCSAISFLIESAGDFPFEDHTRELAPSQILESIARVIQALKRVQESGFTHNDFHLYNVLFKSETNPGDTLKLIDFGYATPIGNRNGEFVIRYDEINLMKRDMAELATYVTQLLTISGAPKEMVESLRGPIEGFYRSVNQLGVFEKPDYDKWISVFSRLAKMAA